MELEESGEQEKTFLQHRLESLEVEYEFVQLEGEGDIGPMLADVWLINEYINENITDLGMLIMGSTHKGSLEKWMVGSVTDYCLQHSPCPVTVVKQR